MAGTNNTPFSPNCDKLAQITAFGGPPPGSVNPVFAAAVSLASIMQFSMYSRIQGNSAVSATCAVTTTFLPTAFPGANFTVSCAATGAGTVTYTFGAGFKTAGTAAPTTGTEISIEFNFNGTNWIEQGRSSAITF